MSVRARLGEAFYGHAGRPGQRGGSAPGRGGVGKKGDVGSQIKGLIRRHDAKLARLKAKGEGKTTVRQVAKGVMRADTTLGKASGGGVLIKGIVSRMGFQNRKAKVVKVKPPVENVRSMLKSMGRTPTIKGILLNRVHKAVKAGAMKAR